MPPNADRKAFVKFLKASAGFGAVDLDNSAVYRFLFSNRQDEKKIRRHYRVSAIAERMSKAMAVRYKDDLAILCYRQDVAITVT
jgi:hypothetical protein